MKVKDAIRLDLKVEKLRQEVKQAEAKYKLMREANADLVVENSVLKRLEGKNTFVIPSIPPNGKKEATAVALASDWHWEETVHSANVNGLNEFNTEIARQRADRFFQNIVRLCDIFGRESNVRTLVLALLGDFINGQLREEACENNSLRPMDALIQVWKVIGGGIKFILKNSSLDLVIPCSVGNHSRITQKVHPSTEQGNALETVLYYGLASEFKDEPRVKFVIGTSYHSYVDIAGFAVRFHHGHAIKYNGGVGGIFIPSFKAISQWDKGRRADLDCFGHYHQSKDGGKFLCNGSLIGFNEFAVFIKADYEKPKQTFFLVDHKRQEKIITTSIFLD